uniref:Uncharacterized protein n=1 Tax=Oryza meridionalis TaxID=40149 RepID=A0A0E0DNE5_9ORYZ
MSKRHSPVSGSPLAKSGKEARVVASLKVGRWRGSGPSARCDGCLMLPMLWRLWRHDLHVGIVYRVSSLWCCRRSGGDRPRIEGVVLVLCSTLGGLCLCGYHVVLGHLLWCTSDLDSFCRVFPVTLLLNTLIWMASFGLSDKKNIQSSFLITNP